MPADEKQVASLASALHDCRKKLDRVQTLYEQTDTLNRQMLVSGDDIRQETLETQQMEALLKLENQTENLANAVRLLPMYTGRVFAKQQAEDCLVDAAGAFCERLAMGWICLHLPVLLPRKSYGSPLWIRKTADLSIQRWIQENGPYVIDVPCTIVFRHLYSFRRPYGACRDHDNIELNAIVDTMTQYFLKDDHPFQLRHYYLSALAETDGTEVYLVPNTEFALFLETAAEADSDFL